MTTQTNFLGIPIDGDITRGSSRKARRPIEDLEPMLRAVLADPAIDSFGWKQYTPYFNDGDPCEFSVGTPWFRTTSDAADASTYDLELCSHPTLAARTWNGSTYVDRALDPETAERSARCKALSDAIERGAFEDVLLASFGDHAMVTVRASGITVDFYEHD